MDAENEAPDATLVIAIEPPITTKTRVYTSLDLREPRVSEVKAAEEVLGSLLTPASVTASESKLLALVAGWELEAVDDLPSSVLDRASAFLEHFEARGRSHTETGPEITIELAAPVEVTKGSFVEMVLREPRVSERKRAEQFLSKGVTAATSRAAEISLVTDISGWPPAAVLKMPIGSFARAAAYVTNFLERGRRTGGSSQPT